MLEVVPCTNVADDPAQNFELDPGVLLSRHKAARLGGMPIIGYYHSHPNGRVEPSATDAAQAANDRRYWVIIAGNCVSGWRPVGQAEQVIGFESIPILVEG